MIFQFGIVVIGMICGTVLVIAGHPEAAGAIAVATVSVFALSML